MNRGTTQVVCPWCGYHHLNSHEFYDAGDEACWICADCGNPFSLQVEVVSYFTTKKVDKDERRSNRQANTSGRR